MLPILLSFRVRIQVYGGKDKGASWGRVSVLSQDVDNNMTDSP